MKEPKQDRPLVVATVAKVLRDGGNIVSSQPPAAKPAQPPTAQPEPFTFDMENLEDELWKLQSQISNYREVLADCDLHLEKQNERLTAAQALLEDAEERLAQPARIRFTSDARYDQQKAKAVIADAKEKIVDMAARQSRAKHALATYEERLKQFPMREFKRQQKARQASARAGKMPNVPYPQSEYLRR